MWTLIALPVTCWLCVLLALPRKPRSGNEVEELVYARLLGRQQRLLLLALLLTALAFLIGVVSLPRQVDADLSTVRRVHATCPQASGDDLVCASVPPGMRAVREIQDDGKPAVVSTYVVPGGVGARTTGP